MDGRAASAPERAPRFVPRRDWDPGAVERIDALWPLYDAARAFAEQRSWPSIDDWNDALRGDEPPPRAASGAPIRFERQPSRRVLRSRRQELLGYDESIFLHGIVPSREGNWHDFFNMLAWRSFPDAKRALNARQYEAQQRRVLDGDRDSGRRTREQDALAMLDEGGLLLLAGDPFAALVEDSLARNDHAVLCEMVRAGELAILVFGHALCEQLVADTTSARGFAVVLGAGDDRPSRRAGSTMRRRADLALAQRLSDKSALSAKASPSLPLELAFTPHRWRLQPSR